MLLVRCDSDEMRCDAMRCNGRGGALLVIRRIVHASVETSGKDRVGYIGDVAHGGYGGPGRSGLVGNAKGLIHLPAFERRGAILRTDGRYIESHRGCSLHEECPCRQHENLLLVHCCNFSYFINDNIR